MHTLLLPWCIKRQASWHRRRHDSRCQHAIQACRSGAQYICNPAPSRLRLDSIGSQASLVTVQQLRQLSHPLAPVACHIGAAGLASSLAQETTLDWVRICFCRSGAALASDPASRRHTRPASTRKAVGSPGDGPPKHLHCRHSDHGPCQQARLPGACEMRLTLPKLLLCPTIS